MREQLNEHCLERFIARVAESTVIRTDVSLEDEIYYDLKVYGDPLFDLLDDLFDMFGTDFSTMKASEYAPGEGGHIIRPLLTALGRRPFKSLKVGDVWRAVQAGRWTGTG